MYTRLLLSFVFFSFIHFGAYADTPLHKAAAAGNVHEAETLIAGGADVHAKDDTGMTPLHKAVQANSPQMVNLLFRKGADPDVQEIRGLTPLHLAAQQGNARVVRLLLYEEASPHITANDYDEDLAGKTALDLAREQDHTFIIALLLNQPLLNAMHRADTKRIQELIEQGANIHAEDEAGWTPLHYAARVGDNDVVAFLLAKGADRDAATTFGKKPIDFARQGNHSAVIAQLEQKVVTLPKALQQLRTTLGGLRQALSA